MKIRQHILTFIFVLLCPLTFFGQRNDFIFEKITLEDGLSHNTVESIVLDSDGFVWFGTGNGLNRYDGYQMQVHKSNPSFPESKRISNNKIRCLYLDKQEELWVGTEDGLNKYNKKTEDFSVYRTSPDRKEMAGYNIVKSITEDSKGNFWVGTRGEGLFLFNQEAGSFQNINEKISNDNSKIHNYVHSLIASGDFLWVATEEGLYKLNINTFETKLFTKETGNNFIDDRMYTLFIKDHILWVGTWDGGLIKFNTETEDYKIFTFNANDNFSIGSNIIESIIEHENQLLLGTRAGGLNVFDLKTEHFYKYKNDGDDVNSLSDDNVMALCKTNSNILFIGTMLGGVNKLNLNPKKFTIYRPTDYFENKKTNNKITGIYLQDEILWIINRSGNFVGLDRTTNTAQQYTLPATKKTINCISANTMNGIQHIWFGTDGSGFGSFNTNNKTFQQYTQEDGLGNDYIYSLLAEENRIWVGMFGSSWGGGLDDFDLQKKTFTNYFTIEGDTTSISSYIVYSIYRDKKGRVWVGTKNGGLNRFDEKKGSFQRFVNIPGDTTSIANNNVFCILEDQKGKLWLGTAGGLTQLDPETNTCITYTTEDGLPSDMIYALQQDKYGKIWLSTPNGLSCFDLEKNSLRNFDVQDGLQGNIFNHQASFQSKLGELFFGGTNGVTSFFPDSITYNDIAPKIKLTNLTILNNKVKIGEWKDRIILPQSITTTKEVNLSYKDRLFTIEFAALDFTIPEKNKYKYKLEGLHDDWIETDASKRFAVFSNLQPKRYVLKVMGGNNDGKWSEPTELIIRIKPPFYNSWGFKLGMLAAFGVLVFSFVYSRINKYRKITEQIQKEAKESLLDERNQLRTLIDNIPDFIYIKDKNSRFIVANKKLAKVMGAKSTDDVVGKKDSDFYPKELSDRFIADEQEIMKSVTPIIGKEEPGLDEEGNPAVVSTTKIPLINSSGDIIGLVGIGRDITELKKIQENIRKHAEELHETNVLLEERQEEIFQQKEEISAQAEELEATNAELAKLSVVASETDNAVMIVSCDGVIEWINDGFTRLYGYTLELIMDNSRENYNFKPKLHEFVKRCVKTKKTINYEANVITKKNHKIWVQTMLTPIRDERDNVIKVVAIDSDITKIKEAEAEIQVQRDELKKLNATKDKFFSIIAHDLKNPFHAITSFAELLIKNHNDFEEDKKLELIELIKESADSAYVLLQNLLEWSRTQTDRIKYEPELFNLKELLDENYNLLIGSAEKKNIKLVIDSDEKTIVFADMNMIKTVVRNLISNAIKFTNPFGQISILSKESEKEVLITIQDNGIGMEKDILDNLFELKKSNLKTGTSGETGTGLGLIVCKEFIEKNYGKMTVESTPGKGSAFKFTLPKEEK